MGRGQSLDIVSGVQTYLALTNTTVNMSGQCELHLTATNNMMTTVTPLDAMSGCAINLNSPDAWLFLDGTRPYRVNLGQFFVNGAPAKLGSNVRVVEYGMGTVVIPHPPTYQPLQVFSGSQFTGSSNQLTLYTYYNGTTSINGETNNVAVPLNGGISSFILKRGYAATFAQNADGSGISRLYVAAMGDIRVGALPAGLSGAVGFVRCYPWIWKSKKGWAGGDNSDALLVDAPWNYDWGAGAVSSSSCEYAPMQWGNGYDGNTINNKQGSTMLLGFNEPDSSSQANMTTTQAINDWTNLQNSGLALGSPACTDGGYSSWLFPFINAADAAGLRVDVVKQHFYVCGYSASQLQSWLWNIHVNTGRHVGLTEFNNGANWTTCAVPTYDQEASTIQAFISMMDSQPWVEGYNIYEWVQTQRMMATNGVLTEAGTNYLNEWSPIGYLQELAGNPKWYLAINGGVGPTNAIYDFANGGLDSSGYGNNALLAGSRTFVSDSTNVALSFDGVHDYAVLPPCVGKSANFTFAAWVYWRGGANWQRIFDFGLDPNQYFFLTPSSGSGTLRFAITTSGNNAGSGEQRVETSPLTPNLWTHVAITINGSTGKLFTNGVLAASNSAMTINPSAVASVYAFLGKSQYGPDPLFKGLLADVVVDGYALTDSQVAALAASSQPPAVPAAPAAPTGLSATAVSSYQINLSWTGNSAASSYNVYRSTTSGGPYTAVANGLTGTSFNDTSGNAGTTYYYVVTAVNLNGASANSTQASAITSTAVPGVPSEVTARAGSGLVTISWVASSSPGAITYNIKRATVSGGPYTTIASGLTAPALGNYTDTSVSYTTYYYVVSGVNAYGESANSAEATAVVRDLYAYWKFDETNGAIASDSAGTNNGTLGSGCTWIAGETNGAIHLDGTANAYVSLPTGLVSPLMDFSVATWVNIDTNLAWQRIFDFGSGTGNYMFLTPQAGSSGPLRFAITTGNGEQQINGTAALPAGAWHHVAVTLSNTLGILYLDGVAVGTNSNMTLEPMNLGNTTQNTIGQSQFSADPHLTGAVDDFRIYGRALSASEVVSLATGGCSPPAAPASLSATGGNAQISLSWTASTGATSYTIKRATSSSGPYSQIASGVTATTYVDTGLAAGTTYYYVIDAVDSCGSSGDSAYRGATTVPAVPTGLTATAGNNQVALSWSSSAGASSYNVKRATVSGGPYTTLTNTTSASFTDTTALNGTTYYYVVSAVNTAGESANSSEVSATPGAPVAPTSLAASAGRRKVTLTWTQSTSANITTNNVYRALVNGGPYTRTASVAATTSYTDSSVTTGTTYYYVVTAVNSGGLESPYSNQASATAK